MDEEREGVLVPVPPAVLVSAPAPAPTRARPGRLVVLRELRRCRRDGSLPPWNFER